MVVGCELIQNIVGGILLYFICYWMVVNLLMLLLVIVGVLVLFKMWVQYFFDVIIDLVMVIV